MKALLDHAVDTTHLLQDKIRELERGNLRLVQERKTALEKLEECACLKEQVPLASISIMLCRTLLSPAQIETDLYNKFKLVLNGKKSKIRHLMEELASCQTQCQSSTATDPAESPKPEMRNRDKMPQHTPPPSLGISQVLEK